MGLEGLEPSIFWVLVLSSHERNEPLNNSNAYRNSDNCLFHAFLCPRMRFIAPQIQKAWAAVALPTPPLRELTMITWNHYSRLWSLPPQSGPAPCIFFASRRLWDWIATSFNCTSSQAASMSSSYSSCRYESSISGMREIFPVSFRFVAVVVFPLFSRSRACVLNLLMAIVFQRRRSARIGRKFRRGKINILCDVFPTFQSYMSIYNFLFCSNRCSVLLLFNLLW